MKEKIKGSVNGLKIVSENATVLNLNCEDIPSIATENINTVVCSANTEVTKAYTFTLTNSNSPHQILFLKLMGSLKNL